MSSNHSVVIAMPTFNDGDATISFVREIQSNVVQEEMQIVIVDDCSEDGSWERIRAEFSGDPRVLVLRNQSNLGHGPSTHRALTAAHSSGAEVVLSCDGDGNVVVADLIALARVLDRSQYAEGNRLGRRDPWFRRIITLFVRELVWLSTHERPIDGNTPFRAYKRDFLGTVIREIPSTFPVPNLAISLLARRKLSAVVESGVREQLRNTENRLGTTWGQKNPIIPSRRLLRFAGQAFFAWLRFQRQQSSSRV